MSLSAIYFGSSSWLIQIDGFRILIDPWLRGDLFFSPGPWLIKTLLIFDKLILLSARKSKIILTNWSKLSLLLSCLILYSLLLFMIFL